MVELLKASTQAISAAKENPLALVALLLILIAWVIVTLRVRRNKQLLQSLEKLPEKDRLKALVAEMGQFKIKGGISADQWLRSRTQQYRFAAFALICLLIVILTAILWFSRTPRLRSGLSIDLNISPAGTRRAPASGNARGDSNATTERQMGEQAVTADRIVSYESRLETDGPHIGYRLPYLDLLRRGGPIEGIATGGTAFIWRFPELSVKVVNNTKEMMVISRGSLRILESRAEETPILLVDDLSVGDLVFRNEGWANVTNAVLEVSVEEPRAPDEIPLFASETTTLELGDFGAERRVPLIRFLPARLRDAALLSVSGRIGFLHGDRRETVNFRTRVATQVRTAAGIPASQTYDTFFRAGEAPVTIGLDIAQQIPPGTADRFVIVLGTDKTSHNRIRLDFETAGGETLFGGEISVDLFVPRSAAKPSGPNG